MAKSRKTSGKTSRKTARKASARKRTSRKPARASARKVELRPIRRQLEAHKKSLRGAEQTQKVKSALKRLDRCLREIRAICGPDMSIPLG